MKGKIVIITGGATGIGLAAAERFTKLGANVIIAGRNEAQGLRAVNHLKDFGREVDFIKSDISMAQDVNVLISKTVEKYGRLDIAFNNAGIEGTFSGICDSTEQEFEELISINLKGTWLCIKHEIEQMKNQKEGGVIVNTSSWLSKGAYPNSSIYSASKAGIDAMIRSIALEAAPFGIRINNVNPGYIVTPMFERFFNPESEEASALKKHAPLNRFGQAVEIADAVVWLSSPESSFVTGQSISIDGGLTIPHPGM